MSSPHAHAGPIYTDAQLAKYLERIKYPSTSSGNELVQEVRNAFETNALELLTRLQRFHLAAIPWGNSGLHYSQHHTISLNPETLFEKMVDRKLDGYCMENTGIFFHILRCLGFHVYATGGRVSRSLATGKDDGRYMPIGHMILIAIINGSKYMIDVGFGNNCATAPLPLVENEPAPNIEPSLMRLVKESLAESIDKDQKFWVYQTKQTPDSDWMPNICFSEMEFLPQDFAMVNFGVSQRRTSWFTHIFVCMRMILDPTGEKIVGQCIVSGKEVKRRLNGKTEVLQALNSEEERVEALRKYFDMNLREDEIQGIQGLSSELK